MENKTNDITALRSILFDTLNKLNDKDSPMDLDRARTIANVAQTIINSAKVEVDYAKATGQTSSSWFLLDDKPAATKPDGGYTHRIGQRHN